MAERVDVRLFIEGNQIPFQSVNIQSTEHAPSSCTIDVAPSEHVKTLLPRSHVILFYREDDDSTWRVLWDGELRGWGMSKSAESSQMQITCVDHSNAFGFMTRYVIDGMNISGQTPTIARFYTGDQITLQPDGGGTWASIVERVVQEGGSRLGREQADFGVVMKELIEELWNNVPYFANALQTTRYLPRIRTLNDEKISTILTNNVAANFIRGITQNQFNGNVSFDQVLQYFLQVAGYTRCPIIAPPYQNGIPVQMLLKPSAYFSVPPCCNCFFPGMVNSHSGFGKDYFTEPTRVMLSTEAFPGAEGNTFRGLFFYNDSESVLDRSGTSTETLVKAMLSVEELERGILPLVRAVDYEKAVLAREVANPSGDQTAFINAMRGYAYYEYINARYQQRMCSINMGFSPYPVVGMPGALFDFNQTLFGHVQAVSHTISAYGSASTMVQMSHVYEADRASTDSITSAPIPFWVSDRYRPNQCDSTYHDLFGDNIIDGTKHAAMGGPGIDNAVRRINRAAVQDQANPFYSEDQYNIADIANVVFPIPVNVAELATQNVVSQQEEPPLYEQHKNNTYSFEKSYTFRPVCTAKQYMQYMGLTEAESYEDGDELPRNFAQGNALFQHAAGLDLQSDGTYVEDGKTPRKYNRARRLHNDLFNSTGRQGG